MNSKEDPMPPDRNNWAKRLCFACLSTNRQLQPVGETWNWFSYLVQKVMPDRSSTLLCWECRAMVRKFKLFRDKVDRAQHLLRTHCQSANRDTPLECLTSFALVNFGRIEMSPSESPKDELSTKSSETSSDTTISYDDRDNVSAKSIKTSIKRELVEPASHKNKVNSEKDNVAAKSIKTSIKKDLDESSSHKNKVNSEKDNVAAESIKTSIKRELQESASHQLDNVKDILSAKSITREPETLNQVVDKVNTVKKSLKTTTKTVPIASSSRNTNQSDSQYDMTVEIKQEAIDSEEIDDETFEVPIITHTESVTKIKTDSETVATDAWSNSEVFEENDDGNIQQIAEEIEENYDCDVNVSDSSDSSDCETDSQIKGDSKYKKKLKEVDFSSLERSRSKKFEYVDKPNIVKQLKAAKKVWVPLPEIEEMMKKDRDSEYFKHISLKCAKCVVKVEKFEQIMHERNHLKTDAKQFVCKLCELAFATEKNVVFHTNKCHTFVLECSVCGARHYSRDVMLEHLSEHVRNVRCRICRAVFLSKHALYAHFRTRHCHYICDHCPKRCHSRHAIARHMIGRHLPSKCSECNKTFMSHQLMKSHMYAEHYPPNDPPQGSGYCELCQRKYSGPAGLYWHMNTSLSHRNTKPPTPRAEKPPSTRKPRDRVECQICHKSYYNLYYMSKHYEMVHSRTSEHQCQQCGKLWASKSRLLYHVKTVHNGWKPKKDKYCDICGQGFSTNLILANHKRTHTGEKPFECADCGWTFAQRSALLHHIHRNHPTAGQHQLGTASEIV